MRELHIYEQVRPRFIEYFEAYPLKKIEKEFKIMKKQKALNRSLTKQELIEFDFL